jgi:flavin-dependent dehydrogenase
MEQSEFYSAPVPCLSPRTWKTNKIAGDGWALLGDAAGLVDPITGEGIYFAFKSAQILSDSIEAPQEYSRQVWNDLANDLARAAHMYHRFYQGNFLGGDFKKRTIQFSRRSRTLKAILGNLIAGNQNYIGLKRKLLFSAPRISWDLLTGRS